MISGAASECSAGRWEICWEMFDFDVSISAGVLVCTYLWTQEQWGRVQNQHQKVDSDCVSYFPAFFFH